MENSINISNVFCKVEGLTEAFNSLKEVNAIDVFSFDEKTNRFIPKPMSHLDSVIYSLGSVISFNNFRENKYAGPLISQYVPAGQLYKGMEVIGKMEEMTKELKSFSESITSPILTFEEQKEVLYKKLCRLDQACREASEKLKRLPGVTQDTIAHKFKEMRLQHIDSVMGINRNLVEEKTLQEDIFSFVKNHMEMHQGIENRLPLLDATLAHISGKYGFEDRQLIKEHALNAYVAYHLSDENTPKSSFGIFLKDVAADVEKDFTAVSSEELKAVVKAQIRVLKVARRSGKTNAFEYYEGTFTSRQVQAKANELAWSMRNKLKEFGLKVTHEQAMVSLALLYASL